MLIGPRALIKKLTTAKPLRFLPRRLKALSGRRRSQALGLSQGDRPLFGAKRRALEKVYGSIGSLEVRLAQTHAEVRAAQSLRYRVFFEEMSATPSITASIRRRDEDPYDPLCDHLLVVDRTGKPGPPRAALAAAIDASSRSSVPIGFCAKKSPNDTTASIRKANTMSLRCSPPRAIWNSWSWAVAACCRPIARSGPSSCCGTACGPISARTASTS